MVEQANAPRRRSGDGPRVRTACLDHCEIALEEAERNSDMSDVCSDPTFMAAVSGCEHCLAAMVLPPGNQTLVIDAPLVKYLNFCGSGYEPFATGAVVLEDGRSKTLVLLAPEETSPTTLTTTAPAPKGASTPPSTGVPATTTAPSNGAPSASPSPPAADAPGKAWIAGPVVGALAGIALVLGALLYLWCRRRRPRNSGEHNPRSEKPQYQFVSRPRSLHELESQGIHELHGCCPNPSEVSVNEGSPAQPSVKIAGHTPDD